LVNVREHHDHFESGVGLAALGGQELEPVAEAHLEVLLCFLSSCSIATICNGALDEHEEGWGLIRGGGGNVGEHIVMEGMEFFLPCHIPQRNPDAFACYGSDFDALGALWRHIITVGGIA
jgi:hypothetical protein